MTKGRKFYMGAAVAALALLGSGAWAWLSYGSLVPARTIDRNEATTRARIVSLNLCTDQLLLHVGDRAQIAGLTSFASDPSMSAAADMARGLPAVAHSGENLLKIAPNILIGAPASGSPQARLFAAGQVKIVDLPYVTQYDEILGSLRLVGKVTGHSDRAENLIAAMNKRLATVPANGNGRIAAYYQRRGFMTGTGTLVDDMMRRLGLRNLATVLNRPALAQLSLEEMVAANPDFLIVEDQGAANDQGSEMLDHPALAHIPRLRISEAMTVCGGPEYPAALEILSRQIADHDRKAGAS